MLLVALLLVLLAPLVLLVCDLEPIFFTIFRQWGCPECEEVDTFLVVIAQLSKPFPPETKAYIGSVGF